MAVNENSLTTEERATLALSSLYSSCAYTRFKMSKFEEYDLYVKNKDFLVSDRMITFTDRSGALLALKPDVTLSIIKNTLDSGGVRKVYYNESVYRALKGESSFREITQTGLECIGRLDFYNICEVITLAAKSLECISSEFVLDISHLGFVSGLIESAGLSEICGELLGLLGEKNVSAIRAVCRQRGVSQKYSEALESLAVTSGDLEGVSQALMPLCETEEMSAALNDLIKIGDALKVSGLYGRVRLDFSVVNDMRYYSGIVFQGFIKGIPSGVLSGGQYDGLVEKMGKSACAIGFAVYLDELESLCAGGKQFDADVLLIYNENDPADRVLEAVSGITAGGESVFAGKCDDGSVKYKRLVRLSEVAYNG